MTHCQIITCRLYIISASNGLIIATCVYLRAFSFEMAESRHFVLHKELREIEIIHYIYAEVGTNFVTVLKSGL